MDEMHCVEDEKTPVLLHAKSFAFGHHELGTRLVWFTNLTFINVHTVPTPIEFSAAVLRGQLAGGQLARQHALFLVQGRDHLGDSLQALVIERGELGGDQLYSLHPGHGRNYHNPSRATAPDVRESDA